MPRLEFFFPVLIFHRVIREQACPAGLDPAIEEQKSDVWLYKEFYRQGASAPLLIYPG